MESPRIAVTNRVASPKLACRKDSAGILKRPDSADHRRWQAERYGSRATHGRLASIHGDKNRRRRGEGGHGSRAIVSVAATAALVAGVVCGLAPLAQAVRIRVKRSSEDVSLLWLSLYACGAVVWLLYGIGEASLPLIVSQVVAMTSVTLALALAIRARRVVRRRRLVEPRRSDRFAEPSGDRERSTKRREAVPSTPCGSFDKNGGAATPPESSSFGRAATALGEEDPPPGRRQRTVSSRSIAP